LTIDIRNALYIPTIYLRNAELTAVKELPEAAKDLLCPIFCLKPWLNSNQLNTAMEKIESVFSSRKYFLDIDPWKDVGEIKRPADAQYQALIQNENGNYNWIKFFEDHPNASPCIIVNHGDLNSIINQIAEFTKAEKTFLVRLSRENGKSFDAIVDEVCLVDHSNFGFVIDVGWSRDLLALQGWANSLVKRIVSKRGDDIPIIITGSSFPDSFQKFEPGDSASLNERILFDLIKSQNNQAKLVYGDWASSRSPSEGGGGQIPPRIDLSTHMAWEIFRFDNDEGGFLTAAKKAKQSKAYPKHLQIWATYMIDATALGDPSGISSQFKSAAVRINLHLYQQLYFDQIEFPTNTDDDYTE
jgi:hypothetical protein